MAALPTIDLQTTEQKLTLDLAVAEFHKIVEEHYDSLGLTEEERDARYDSARAYLDAKNAESAKA